MGIKVSFTSLGCDKNLIDSEIMLNLMNEAGYEIVTNDEIAEVIVVNTCCFINDAKQESIEQIIDLGELKETGDCKALIVTGCMAERYADEIFEELPEVNAVVGTGSYEKIVDVITQTLEGLKVKQLDDINDRELGYQKRVLTTAGYFAHIKIAEGCNNHCTYCVIPKIRGKFRSRKIEDIVREAKDLVAQGVKEIIIVAQDTTMYGIDLYDKQALPDLLKELCKIDNLEWVRLLYCYPEEITDELIDVIAEEPKVCKYMDMPIQHANDTVLKRMARRTNQKLIREKINTLRERVPGMALRTTLITGFPGETEEEFEDMYNFVKEMRFDRLGVFTYSQEEGTPAAKMEDQISEDTKEVRKEKIMSLQKQISEENAHGMIGKNVKVLIDGKIPEDNVYCGRTYKDAPDIDGFIFVNTSERYLSGDFVTCKVVGAYEYDLIGEIIDGDEHCE